MDVFTTFGTTYLGGSCTQWSIRNAPIGVDAPVGGWVHLLDIHWRLERKCRCTHCGAEAKCTHALRLNAPNCMDALIGNAEALIENAPIGDAP